MGANTTYAFKGVRQLFYLVPPSESQFARHQDVPDYVKEAAPYFLGAILLEAILSTITGLAPRMRINDGISSLTAGMTSGMTKMVVMALELSAYVWVYERYNYFDLPWNSAYTWWLCFFGMDLGYYFFHRAGHEVNAFWATHQPHHSSEDYNLSTALRQGAIQSYVSWIFYVPMAIAIPPSVFFVHAQFNLLYQFWIHTQLIKSIGPLEYILNTPSHHRVHHGRNRYCIDKNYGGTLIIWDRLFGTFQAENEPVVYGLTHPINTWDPVWAQIHHFKHILERVWAIKGLKNKLGVLYKGPGWAPGKPHLGDINDIPDVNHANAKQYNSSLPNWATYYVLMHFLLSLLFFNILGSKQKVLPCSTVTLGVILTMASLYCYGALFDKKSHAPYLEFCRTFGYFLADFSLFPFTGILGLSRWFDVIYRWWFAFSASLWFFLSFKHYRATKQ
ncbi:alkylglycerol monooxygenase-like [Oscarella lobularis]|uniref:alkylglycerol monooxygenase-like n=1 Tax=Oscarella lobularis TaxID=121494 RepID=UPI0033134E75